jgi:hypothetical protein
MVNNSNNNNKMNNHLSSHTIEQKKMTKSFGIGNRGPAGLILLTKAIYWNIDFFFEFQPHQWCNG